MSDLLRLAEKLVVADIDPALATRLMFHLGEEAVAGQAASEDSTELLRTLNG